MTPDATPPADGAPQALAEDMTILIPARYASSRLPGKMLLDRSGKPLIQHVVERAQEIPGRPRVFVLTDDERIRDAVEAFGGEAWMTDPDHRSGTDRCAEAAARLATPIVVNVQGDEPFFAPEDLLGLAKAVAAGADIATLGHPFEDDDHLQDPNAVKAIVEVDGVARAFQRAAPEALSPGPGGPPRVWHHQGIYAFRRERLLAFPGLAPTAGELRERLEQLRALEHGWRIVVLEASAPAFGVDSPDDYEAFLARLDAH